MAPLTIDHVVTAQQLHPCRASVEAPDDDHRLHQCLDAIADALIARMSAAKLR